MKKISLGLIAFASFVVVFVNSYIPPSYDIIEQQQEGMLIDFEKRPDVLYEELKSCRDEYNSGLVAE